MDEVTSETIGNHLKGGNKGDNSEHQQVDIKFLQKKIMRERLTCKNAIFPHCLLKDWPNITKTNIKNNHAQTAKLYFSPNFSIDILYNNIQCFIVKAAFIQPSLVVHYMYTIENTLDK